MDPKTSAELQELVHPGTARLQPTSPPSFRDPAGRVVVADGRVLRWISSSHCEEFQACCDSSAFKALVDAGQIVSHRVLDPAEASYLAERYELAELSTLAANDLVLEHERIPFVSFPYEWCPEMLEAAGCLTLDVMERLLQEGLGLKDATPYNVLFCGSRPVFIDTLSVERRDPLDPLWLPYAQFVRTFLLPLAMQQRLGLSLQYILFGRREGIEPEEAYRACGLWTKLSPPMLTLATLPTWLGSWRADARSYGKRRLRSSQQARFVTKRLVAGLRRQLMRLAPSGRTSSRWSQYSEASESYSTQQLAQKGEFIGQVLSKYRPRNVLDVGCNTGRFSLQAARHGASVVAIDSDPVVIGRLWRQASSEKLDVLPLVVNVARPSPALGWRNRECPAFLDRASGAFDMVFLLALVHHLFVTERIPLGEIIDLAAELATDMAIIEYVGSADPMLQRLLRGREDLYERLTATVFEAAVQKRFHILQSQQIQGADRQVYLLRKLSRTAVTEADRKQSQVLSCIT